MKRYARIVFALTLVVFAAQPMFACINCLPSGICGRDTTNVKCKPLTSTDCIDGLPCAGFTASLGSEYRIASVEITHGTDTRVAEVKTAKPAVARK
ncbi:MAG TPA: hypothetical protein VM733_10305 [Thermoanaerobaculia bacterium]|nr:hypothetical protein [Thermoanaerobaculia bacterium]